MLARAGLDAVTNVLFRGLPGLLGYGTMQVIGEAEYMGGDIADPVTLHNNPNMDGVR